MKSMLTSFEVNVRWTLTLLDIYLWVCSRIQWIRSIEVFTGDWKAFSSLLRITSQAYQWRSGVPSYGPLKLTEHLASNDSMGLLPWLPVVVVQQELSTCRWYVLCVNTSLLKRLIYLTVDLTVMRGVCKPKSSCSAGNPRKLVRFTHRQNLLAD